MKMELGETRTIRNPMLYPFELRARNRIVMITELSGFRLLARTGELFTLSIAFRTALVDNPPATLSF
jgi:hypothetical protein